MEDRSETPSAKQHRALSHTNVLGTASPSDSICRSVVALQALLISGLVFNLFRRRRAESSLGESEKRFQTVADATPVLIWMTGEDQGCTYLQQSLARVYRSLHGAGTWARLAGGRPSGGPGQGHAEPGRCFNAREPFATQYRLRRHDGEYRWITDQGVPRYGPRGNFRGYVGACVDITDLLKKERSCMRVRSASRSRPRRPVSGCGSLTWRRTNSGFRTKGANFRLRTGGR